MSVLRVFVDVKVDPVVDISMNQVVDINVDQLEDIRVYLYLKWFT